MTTKEIEQSLDIIKNSRRAHERFSYEKPIKLMIQDVAIKGEMKNLSIGGAFIVFDTAVSVKDQIEMVFDLPGIKQIKVNCEIVWVVPESSNKIGSGVKFSHLPTNAVNAIMSLLKDKDLLHI